MMEKNCTKIKNDKDFLLKLDSVILELNNNFKKISVTANVAIEFLIEIQEITKNNKKVAKSEKDQFKGSGRALEDDGDFYYSKIGDKIAEILYYFSYIYQISS